MFLKLFVQNIPFSWLSGSGGWWLSSLQHMQHIWPNTFKVSDESALQYNSVFTYQAMLSQCLILLVLTLG